MRYTAILLSFILLLASTGCEDSPEHKLGLAKIAMRKGVPSQALDHVDSVLAGQPDNIAALTIKAKAHLSLRQYEQSWTTFQKLFEMDPQDAEIYRNITQWSYSKMAFILSKSDFVTDDELSKEFTEAKAIGHDHADWLAKQDDTRIEAEFIRARLILLDSRQMELRLAHEKKLLRNAAIASSKDEDLTTPTIEELNRNIRSMKFRAEQHLYNVMVASPEHFDSALVYIDLLIDREGWEGVWVLAEKLREQKDTPPLLARKVIEAVLTIPNAYQPEDKRLEMSQRILATVTKKEAPAWSLIQTRLFMELGEYDKAYEVAEQLFRKQPNDNETRFNFAWTLFGIKKYDLAKTTLGPLAAEMRDHSNIQSLYGRLLAAMGDRRGAASYLRRAVELNPNAYKARAVLIEILSENTQTAAAAIKDVEELYKKNPSDPTAIRFMMQALISQDAKDEIAALITKVLSLSPLESGHIRVVIGGYVYLQLYDRAMQYTKELIRREPDSPVGYMSLAGLHVRQGDVEEAKRILQEVSKRHPDSMSANMQLANLYMTEGRYDHAADLAIAILKEEPESIDARVLLASAYTQLALTEKALEETKLVLEKNPREPRAHELAARIYRMLGEEENADIHIGKIDETAIDVKRYPGLVARLKYEKGNVDEALAICNEAVRLGTATPLVRMILAEIQLTNKNDLAQGEIHLLAYARNNPTDITPFVLLERFYARHNADRGIREFERLRSVNESYARLAQARLMTKYGRNTDAFKTLLEHYPTLIQNRKMLALTYASMISRIVLTQDPNAETQFKAIWTPLIKAGFQQYKAEMVLLDRASKTQDPDKTIAQLVELGDRLPLSEFDVFLECIARLANLKASDHALKLIDKWIAQKPDDISLLSIRADNLARANRLDEAVAAFEDAIKRKTDPEALLMRLADTHQLRYDFPATEATLDRMAAVSSGSRVTALWLKATLFIRLGLTEKAVETLEVLRSTGESGDPRVLQALGQALATLGRMKDAKSALMSIPPYAAQYAQAQILLARIEQTDKSTITDAKARLERLLQTPENANDAAKELIQLAQRAGDLEQVITWADQALTTPNVPATTQARWLMIRSEMKAQKSDWIGVQQDIDAFLKISPKATQWQVAKIAVLDHLNRLDEARTFFSNNPELAKDENGMLAAAALGIKTAVPSQPFNAYLINMANGNFDAAAQAVRSMPNASDVLYRQDLLDDIERTKAGDIDKAVFARLALAAAAQQSGVAKVSETICSNAAQTQPRCVTAHAMRLISSQQSNSQGQKVKAADVVDSSLRLFLTAREMEALETPNTKQAIALNKELLTREPDHIPTVFSLIRLYLNENMHDDALAMMEAWYAKPGRHQSFIANDMAFLLIKHFPDRMDDAVNAAKKALELLPNSPAVKDTMGWVEYHRGNHKVALHWLAQAWSTEHRSADWHLHMGQTFKALGETRWARYHLEHAVSRGGNAKLEAEKSLDQLKSEG